ncbi:hypothetical protein ACHAWF_018399 [Thalassiosira exigua]
MMPNCHSTTMTTPEKKSSRRCRRPDCPCRTFHSDESVASAVDSDERTEALISWLLGHSAPGIDGGPPSGPDGPLPTRGDRCPNRLRASVTILNAIRDACRPYLESSAPNQVASSSSPPPSSRAEAAQAHGPTQTAFSPRRPVNTHAHVQSTFTEKASTYEDSFPSLSSAPPTAPPTILVGRKKSKGQWKNNQPFSSQNHPAAHYVLVGRKKNKGPSNNKQQPPIHGTSCHNRKNGNVASSDNDRPTTSKHCNALMPRKKTQAVTVSINVSSPSRVRGESPQTKIASSSCQLGGNISSLPSQDASEMMGLKSVATSQPNRGVMEPPELHPSKIIDSSLVKARSTSADAFNASNGATIDPSANLKLKRLVRMYSTILRTHLAPFLLLELHLLVRLMSLPDERITNTVDTQQFSSIFRSNQSCREFAAGTLNAVKTAVLNLGHETVKMFLALPAIERQCPRLFAELRAVVDAGNAALLFEAGQKALGSNANTPHLTLPFDRERDSRHNYRSAESNRLFREREELRDSFLYQLRAFQDVRGKLMDRQQAEGHIDSIKRRSRGMMENLSPGNTLWFVDFFCDLLLQVGLVPIGETDSEVLERIGDKKRLQKLHMRFTSRTGQANKSSRKLVIEHKGTSSNANMSEESNFPGHQEFFSIFLLACDSYKFNVHLKRQLARIIMNMTEVNETKGLCHHIAKTQMLAKFLGMLVFCPNWDIDNGNIASNHCSQNIVDAGASPINVKECIESAWRRRRLVVVVPFVVQFLGMIKWCANVYAICFYAIFILHVQLIDECHLCCPQGWSIEKI